MYEISIHLDIIIADQRQNDIILTRRVHENIFIFHFHRTRRGTRPAGDTQFTNLLFIQIITVMIGVKFESRVLYKNNSWIVFKFFKIVAFCNIVPTFVKM